MGEVDYAADVRADERGVARREVVSSFPDSRELIDNRWVWGDDARAFWGK